MHGQHEATGADLGERLEGDAYGAASCNAVVDNYDSLSRERNRRSGAIERPPALDFRQLPVYLAVYVVLACARHARGRLIDHELRQCTVDQGSDAIFLMVRSADLAHQQHVERCIELYRFTRRAYELGRTCDWGVIYYGRDDTPEGQGAVVTERQELSPAAAWYEDAKYIAMPELGKSAQHSISSW
jgi:hypothetical protein